MFLQSGASVSVPVNLSEPVVAVAVGARQEDAPAEASEGEDEEEEEEEEQVEEKPKPICMDGKTYVRCFKEAVKEALGDRFEEEVTKMHEWKDYVKAYGEDLNTQRVYWERLRESKGLTSETLDRCRGLINWQMNYSHARDEDMCTSSFKRLLEHPIERQVGLFTFMVGLETCRKQTMAGLVCMTNFGSLHHEVENIEALVSAGSSSASGGKGAQENLFAKSTLKLGISQGIVKSAFKDPRIFLTDKNSVLDTLCALPTWRGDVAPDAKVNVYSL